jgi:aconitate hydratase
VQGFFHFQQATGGDRRNRKQKREACRCVAGLTGKETFDLEGLSDGLKPGQILEVKADPAQGPPIRFKAKVRIDTPVEIEVYRHGGILPYVLRQILRETNSQ